MNRRTFIRTAGAAAGLFAVGGSLSTATAVATPSQWTQDQELALGLAWYARRAARAQGSPADTWRDVVATWDPAGEEFTKLVRDDAGFDLGAPVPWPAVERVHARHVARIRARRVRARVC